MKIIKKLNPIQESISKIGETKKSLKEEKEVPLVGVLPNADAVALNQHIEDRKQGLERRENPDKDPIVKEFIDETASAKSRTRHIDVVDRKELAKVLTEAKKNKQKFKVGKSDKLGYRYFVDIFPIYGSQGALDVDDDNAEVDGEESGESLGESLTKPLVEDLEQEFKEYLKWCKENNKNPKDGKSLMDYFKPHKELKESAEGKYTDRLWNALDNGLIDYETVATAAIKWFSDDEIDDLARANDWTFVFEDPEDDEDEYEDDELEDDELEPLEEHKDSSLNEDLQVYTSTLTDFKPAKGAEDLWEEIINKGKLDDLELGLENVFKVKGEENTSIDIEGLNDLLTNHQDFIRTLLDLDNAPLVDKDYDDNFDEEPVGENDLVFDDEEIEEPVDADTSIDIDDEEVDVNDIDGVDADEEDLEIKPVDYEIPDYDEDDIPPVEDDEDDLEESLKEASSAERKAYKVGGETFDDLAQGKAIARIKDPKAREAAIAAVKAGRKDVVKNFTGDRKLNQADNAIIDKFYKMQKAGLVEDTETKEPELKLENKEEPIVECDDKDTDLTESIANGFINKNFVATNSLDTSTETQKESTIKESLKTDGEEEIVEISDDEITEALGMPKESEVEDKKEQQEEKVEECKDGKAQ